MEAPLKKDEVRLRRWAALARHYVEGYTMTYICRIFNLNPWQVSEFAKKWRLNKYRKHKPEQQLSFKKDLLHSEGYPDTQNRK